MVAFLVSMAAVGWRPGHAFPTGDELAAASGAAFLTVVVAQTANAFACRSSTRTPGEVGWRTNRYLLPAIAFALVVAVVTLTIPPIADQLGQTVPNAAGGIVALAGWPVVLGVDALDKRRRRHRRRRHPVATPPALAAGTR
jgi:magnesium-transporting ATPase (P-type)